jgi:hypothetical protein
VSLLGDSARALVPARSGVAHTAVLTPVHFPASENGDSPVLRILINGSCQPWLGNYGAWRTDTGESERWRMKRRILAQQSPCVRAKSFLRFCFVSVPSVVFWVRLRWFFLYRLSKHWFLCVLIS